MSRIGRLPITIPAGVTVKFENGVVTATSTKGTLTLPVAEVINVEINENVITVTRANEEKHTKQLHGTTRANIANMVVGLSEGYKKTLIMKGTGYHAEVKGTNTIMYVGYSHPITLPIPEGVKVSVSGANQTEIAVEGINKQVVGQYAALLRGTRLPEPYLGKGVAYTNEHIRRKEGKKAGK